MRIISVNVGRPATMAWKGREIRTGIFKSPVAGRIAVRTLNLDGDGQADLTVHGGRSKAVYLYPAEHYAYWRGELPRMDLHGLDLPWGMFGENITAAGLVEDAVRIGDRFRLGSAEVMVTEPRLPCYKLGAKFGRDDMVRRFLASRLTGFYLAVVQEGEVEAGDRIVPLTRAECGVTVSEITELYAAKARDRALMERALGCEALPDGWRDWIRERLEHEFARTPENHR